MKKLLFVFLASFILLMTSCGSSPPQPSALHVENNESAQVTTMNVAKAAIFGGNYTYIPLNLSGDAAANTQYVLWALNQFEEAYLLEVISWNVEERHPSLLCDGYLYGIWIHHRPILNRQA